MAAEFIALKLAEAVVTQVVQRISDLLIYEATSLSSVSVELESLRTELTRIKCFLKDANSKQEQDYRVRNWVVEVKDVACEIEDAIETYIFKVHSSYIKASHLRKLRTQINSIKDKIKSIRESRETYQIEFSSYGEGTSNFLRNLRRSYPDDEDKDVISLKDTMATLKAQLIKEEDRLCVVSVVGMGGLGKTTLAKKVYNDVEVKKLFDTHAWVFISQQFVVREVLVEILMQVGFQSQLEGKVFEKQKYKKEFLEERKNRREILKDLDDHELINWVKAELEDKRYFIVLDDIWSIDAWYSIQSAFPKGKMGSKVLFTTRTEAVGKSVDPYSSLIVPPLLNHEQSWELLQLKAFPREHVGERSCPSEFEELGKDMVRKCGGLPLAIVVLGGLLRTKNSLEAWEKVRKDVQSHLVNKLKSQQQYRVEDVLHLSYEDLPYYLKPCFLYLGSFPEDSEICKKDLIRLWIAEGFVSTTEEVNVEGTLMEDVGEQYLEELVNRCMVQVSLRDHTGKGVKSYRLHDLMRDFCISKSKDESFFQAIEQNDEMNRKTNVSLSTHYSTTTNSRRIAIHQDNHHLEQAVHPHLRSLLYYGTETSPILSMRNKNFLLLRVLKIDFPSQRPMKISGGIGNLIHLRYLRLSNSGELILPPSIGNLRNLHTLDLRNNFYVILQGTLSRLKRLRHLLISMYYYSSCPGPSWINTTSCAFPIIRSGLLGNHTLRNILTLKGIHAKDLIRNEVVLELTNILDLEIHHFRSDKEVSLVLNSLGSQLSRLRSLLMTLRWDDKFQNLEVLSRCHVLSRLTLRGELSQDNFSFLPKSLAKLVLSYFHLNQEKLAILEKLPNLRILQFSQDGFHYCTKTIAGDYKLMFSCDGYKLMFSVDGFPKLEILKLSQLWRFENWEVEEGAISNLKRLDIEDIRNLKMIPEGIKYVTTLRELNIIDMSKEFKNRVRVNEDGIEGEDFYKVRHIPSISFK